MEESNSGADLAKIIEQAAALSKIMNGSGLHNDEEKKDNEGDSTDKILKVMELLQSLNTNKTERATKTAESAGAVNEGVEAAAAPLNALKAAVPFIDGKYQRSMAVFIKMIEIQKLMEMYGGGNSVNMQSTPQSWRIGILTAVRPHLNEHKKNTADLLIKILEINDIMNRIKEPKIYL